MTLSFKPPFNVPFTFNDLNLHRVALEDLTQETTDNLMKTLPHVRDYRVMLDEAYSQALPQAQSQSQTEQHSTKGDESKWHVIELTGDETHNKKEREKPTLHPRRPLLPEALQLLRRRHELLAIPKEAINEDDDKSADEVANMRRTRGGNSGTSTSSAWSQTHKKEKKLSAEAKKRLHDSKYIKSLSDNYAKGKAFLQECLFVCDYIGTYETCQSFDLPIISLSYLHKLFSGVKRY